MAHRSGLFLKVKTLVASRRVDVRPDTRACQPAGGGEATSRLLRLGNAAPTIFGAVLLLAAILKAEAGPIPDGTVLSSRGVVLAAAWAEFSLGAWLLSGVGVLRAVAAARWFFIALFGVALYEALLGRESCGCFGAIRLNPWYAVGFDLAAVAAFIVIPSRAPRGPASPLQRFAAGARVASLLLGGIALTDFSFRFAPSHLTVGGKIVGSGHLVAVDPQAWIGHRLPLLRNIDGVDALARGRWVIVFYHHGCAACKRRLPQFEALANEFASVPTAPRFAVVELAPYAPVADAKAEHDSALLHRRLSSDHQWSMPLPTVVRLEDATVSALSSLGQEILASASYDAPPGATDAPRQSRPDFSEYAAAWRHKALGEIACGPLSLITVLERLSIHLSDADKDEIIAAAGTKGTDMAQLNALAQRFGAYTLPVESTTAALRETQLPAVVHVGAIGFAAVTDYSASGLRVVFPMKAPTTISDARFGNAFGTRGMALLIAREQIHAEDLGFSAGRPEGDRASPAAALLRPAKGMLAVGRIYRHDWTCEILIHNDGDEPLVIAESVASLRTTRPRVLPATISPRGSARLLVSGRAEELGSFTEAVTVVSNSAGGRATTIPVRGFVDQPVFAYLPVVAFDPVVEGAMATTTVPIALAEGVAFDALVCNVDDVNLLRAELVDDPERGVALRVEWTGSAPAGWWKGRVSISTGEPDSVASTIDVAAHVLAPIEAQPPQLWVRDTELNDPDAWSRHVLLKRHIPGSSVATWELTDAALRRAVAVTTVCDDDGNLRVAFSPTKPADDIRTVAIHGDACFTFEDGHTCTVHLALGDDALIARSTTFIPDRPD